MEMYHAIVWTKEEGTHPEKYTEEHFSSLQAAQDFVSDFAAGGTFMGTTLPMFEYAKIEKFILHDGDTKYTRSGYAVLSNGGNWDFSPMQ